MSCLAYQPKNTVPTGAIRGPGPCPSVLPYKWQTHVASQERDVLPHLKSSEVIKHILKVPENDFQGGGTLLHRAGPGSASRIEPILEGERASGGRKGGRFWCLTWRSERGQLVCGARGPPGGILVEYAGELGD